MNKNRIMNKISVAFITACMLLCMLCGCFFGCACNEGITRYDYFLFDTNVTVYISGKTPSAQMKKDLDALVNTAKNCFDIENEASEISVFNTTLGQGRVIQLSDTFYSVLTEARKYYSLSRNKFNPALYPLSDLWQFSPAKWKENQRIGNVGINPPNELAIEQALAKISFSFEMNANEKTATRTRDTADTTIDLGGIVKGWLVKEMASIVKSYGDYVGYISAGASSIYVLSCDTVSVVHPINNSENIIQINTAEKKDFSVSTSGDYQKYYYDLQNIYTTYCHIIDDNGYPIKTKTNSVTVLAKDAAFADAISTALCCYAYVPSSSNSPLVAIINEILTNPEYADTIVFAVSSANGGKYVITNAQDGTYTLLDDAYTVVRI